MCPSPSPSKCDGFDVQLITRDASVGGTWAASRVYAGLHINSVHDEYGFSALPMPVPPDAGKTGGRLSGDDIRGYLEQFEERFLKGRVLFRTEVVGVRREEGDVEGLPWVVNVRDIGTDHGTTLRFAKIVLCTGGTSRPKIPEQRSPSSAVKAGFCGAVIHSVDFASRRDEILSTNGSVVVVGGGKSAQDICTSLANVGRDVTLVFEKADAISAVASPLPDFMRKSRMLSVLTPYIHLRTRLELFLHTTWLGNILVHAMWDKVRADSFKFMRIPPNSPFRNTYSAFWSTHSTDEGLFRENGFHALVNSGRIKVIAPARMNGYGEGGHSVVLSTGESVNANVVILATGYTSSWDDLFDENTATDLGLYRHKPVHEPAQDEWRNYRTLANPPPAHPENSKWSSSIYKGIIPAKNLLRRDFAINGAVVSHAVPFNLEFQQNPVGQSWRTGSLHLMQDKMKLPDSPESALKQTERDSAWLRKRYPEHSFSDNEAVASFSAFFSWPQYVDDLLGDMYLPSMRSGGNWLTWPFKVISSDELATLHEEREANRRKHG
ncbi:FAD/NAD-P-binding domain-containing protein [Roridomyces roridus]|uniref:L-ornithine N(5)-monooxygenase [NAD(P)H] n=1 Tax=Roridomyces roridus TaxID=1738132 RepID=A0AAD7BP75_9AGAR|nr:FAD/NAD-P-binding domain-containing protein [Roridomyces roridus]